MRPPLATGFTAEAARFQWRLIGVLTLVVCMTAGAVLWVARRNIAQEEEYRRETEFQAGIALLRSLQQSRHELLVERCRSLATKSRIQAALEDGAEDLLYPSARDELRDLVETASLPGLPSARRPARFYRFLDAQGRVIRPQAGAAAGGLDPEEENRLSLAVLPDEPEVGYLLLRTGTEQPALQEIVVVPIISTADGRKLAALVLGFAPLRFQGMPGGAPFASGIWLDGTLHLLTDATPGAAAVAGKLAASAVGPADRVKLETPDNSWLVFAQRMETGAPYAPAYEVCAFPLGQMIARQRALGWRVLGAGAGVMLLGLALSYALSFRLSEPVDALAHDSQEQRARRVRAEAALETTTAELGRAARFSANASHQLKTPVAVLRAGLEMLQKRGTLNDAEAHEVSVLIHQTYRISGVIEDLLLLSRMDAGQLRLNLGPVNLSELVAAALDDLSALPDGLGPAVEQDCPPGLRIAGEKRYTALILQNLLENARKYNRPDGRIRVVARVADGTVVVTVGNTTRHPIAPEARAHIFERFHRGGHGENIPGYGLGLNLARELARLHGGDLRLERSDEAWTEFTVVFRTAPAGEVTS